MLKNFFIVLFFLSLNNNCVESLAGYKTKVTMPSKEILKEKLKNTKFSGLIDEIGKSAGKELSALQFIRDLDISSLEPDSDDDDDYDSDYEAKMKLYLLRILFPDLTTETLEFIDEILF